MNPTIAPPRHVHLDIELDPRHQFHYRSHGEDGRRTRLHRGDTLTFTCADGFAIRFVERSPFDTNTLQSRKESIIPLREWFVTTSVRDQAEDGVYKYAVEVTRDGRVLSDDPEIIVVSTELT